MESLFQIPNNTEEILKQVKKVKQDPLDYESVKKLADLLLDKKYYDYANKCYDFVLELFPSSGSALYNKGTALFNMEKYEESIT